MLRLSELKTPRIVGGGKGGSQTTMTSKGTTTTASRKTCIASKKDGSKCRANALADSDYCFAHEPSLAAKRAQARKRGGKARHGRTIRHIVNETPPAALATHGDMLEQLEHALEIAHGLENSHSKIRSIVAVVQAAVKIYEVGELEARIVAIENQLANTPQGARGNGHYGY